MVNFSYLFEQSNRHLQSLFVFWLFLFYILGWYTNADHERVRYDKRKSYCCTEQEKKFLLTKYSDYYIFVIYGSTYYKMAKNI